MSSRAVLSLIPVAVPVVFLALHILVSLVQALVFTLLPMIYLGEATRHDAGATGGF